MSQPPVHEHLTCVAAPATWLSPPSGQLTGGADGLYVADRRVLSRLLVTVDGREPDPVEAAPRGAGGARFVGVAGGVTVERSRRVARDGGVEEIVLRNGGQVPVTATLRVVAAADLAPIGAVRAGRAGLTEHPLGERWLAVDGHRVRLTGPTRAEVTLDPGQRHTLTLTVRATRPPAPGFAPAAPPGPPPWSAAPLTVRSADGRLDRLVARGVEDLTALLLADGDDLYCAAGSPWYMTLFGRDALWTARMALPLGYELAAGTLRALARHQGTRHDPETEEEPGKIPHELRSGDAAGWLPPLYYGSVDATPLFVITLAEAWRWGMPRQQVAALLPATERALGWLRGFDGFVSYVGSDGGLAHQGWKDSADAIQHADGRPARPPIALSEVQAYACQAARLGADLLESFGRPAGDLRRWADDLAARFRARFWVAGHPAIAVDGAGRPVAGVASNLGHLLATGLLTAAEEARVAARLAELDTGWGLRTLSDRAAGFDPLSYHRGSVWPHDTAIAVHGLARSGHHALAARLAGGLLAAAPLFGHRLPELFGGQAAPAHPARYPAACHPQAWAAAAPLHLLTALLGLHADLPAGRLTAAAPHRLLAGLAPLTVHNLRTGHPGRPGHPGHAVHTVRVGAAGAATVTAQDE